MDAALPKDADPALDAEPALDVHGLTCERAGRTLLDALTFRLERGAYLAVVGENGAGKSTLLKTLVRLVTLRDPDAVRVRGVPLSRISARDLARQVAYVPQLQGGENTGPFTVLEFLQSARFPWHGSGWFGSAPAGRWGGPEDLRAVDAALGMTGLETFLDRELRTLSGGELQRVWLGAALAQTTPMLLLDEPTSQMDYRQREAVSDVLRRVNRESGITVLHVAHDLQTAAWNATHVLALRAGRGVFFGSVDDFHTPDALESVFGVRFLPFRHEDVAEPVLCPIRSGARGESRGES